MEFFLQTVFALLFLSPLGIAHAFFIQQPDTFHIKLPFFKEDKKQTVFLKTECKLTSKTVTLVWKMRQSGLVIQHAAIEFWTVTGRKKHFTGRNMYLLDQSYFVMWKLLPLRIQISLSLCLDLSLKKNFMLLKNFIFFVIYFKSKYFKIIFLRCNCWNECSLYITLANHRFLCFLHSSNSVCFLN